MNADRYERDDWRRARPGRPIDKRPVRRMYREDRRRGFQQDPMDSVWVLAAFVLAALAIFAARVMGVL